jgi:mannan endo-1,6-alpha-mannosidase
MQEQACETINSCNNDQKSFKAYLSRWLAATVKSAPFTSDTIMPLLRSSATAAALQCSGTSPFPETCGLQWTKGAAFDGSIGIGQQMAALSVVQSNLIQQSKELVTNSTGGTSKGDVNAGSGSATSIADLIAESPVTMKDRVGAGFFTVAVLMSVMGCSFLMISDYGG